MTAIYTVRIMCDLCLTKLEQSSRLSTGFNVMAYRARLAETGWTTDQTMTGQELVDFNIHDYCPKCSKKLADQTTRRRK